MSRASFDGEVLVLGLGAVGAAALYQLARRGARVAGIDQHQPPHALGSSHGETRITRLATGEGDAYVPVVRRSHQIWRALEAASGRTLYTACGGLVLGAPGGRAAAFGRGDFLQRTVARAERHGIRHELLDAATVRRRFPLLEPADHEQGYFEPEAGFVVPEAAIAVQLDQAQRLGATVHTGERVLGLEPQGQRVWVHTERGGQRRSHLADRVLLAVGPWLPQLLAEGLPSGAAAGWAAQFKVYRQVMFWFDAGPAAAHSRVGRQPVFIWAHGEGEEDSFYGFPAAADGPAMVKVASAQFRATTTPQTVQRTVDPQEAADFHARRLAGRLALPAAPALDARACLYTVTPDRGFVVEPLPGLPQVLLASACSGHGFKHSAALGEALAERVLGLVPTLDLAPFAQARLAG